MTNHQTPATPAHLPTLSGSAGTGDDRPALTMADLRRMAGLLRSALALEVDVRGAASVVG